MELNECAECERICDGIETDPPEAPEDRICCRCGNLGYDEKCMACRQDEIETLTDYAVEKYKEDMMK